MGIISAAYCIFRGKRLKRLFSTREEIFIINDKVNYYSRIRNPVDAYFHLIPGEKFLILKVVVNVFLLLMYAIVSSLRSFPLLFFIFRLADFSIFCKGSQPLIKAFKTELILQRRLRA